MILKRGGCFFKVIIVRGAGNKYVFECVNLDSRQRKVFTHEMLGLLEAVDAAASRMRSPKDILLLDLDNQGKWKILTKDEVNRISRSQSKSGF